MDVIWPKNGIMAWSEDEIVVRDNAKDFFVVTFDRLLRSLNPGWRLIQCETSQLQPTTSIGNGYTSDDYYSIDDEGLALRPETTAGSYQYARQVLLNNHHKPKHKLPICVWQMGKSFRKEQDKTISHMRLKEFHQLEFQCIYPEGTACDYPAALHEPIRDMIAAQIGPCRLEPSDRKPHYSSETLDVVCNENNMEVASLSRRNDCDIGNVFEVAIGMDRIVHCFMLQWR